MAYVVAQEALLQITIEGRHENQQVLSVFTYRMRADAPIADGNAMINSVALFWFGAGGMFEKYTSCCSGQLTGLKTRFQWVYPTRFAFVTKVNDVTTGQVIGAAMPVNTSIGITRRTVNAGRQNVGSLHMPAVPASFIVNGALQAAGLTVYEELGNKSLEPITTVAVPAVFSPVHYHKTSPLAGTELTAFETSRFARTMHRRTVGLGS